MQNRNLYLSIAAGVIVLLGLIFYMEARINATVDARVALALEGQDATIDARIALADDSETLLGTVEAQRPLVLTELALEDNNEMLLGTVEAQRPLVLTDVALAYPSETPSPTITPTFTPSPTVFPPLGGFQGVYRIETVSNLGVFASDIEGAYFAASENNILRLYDLNSYQLLQEFEHDSEITQIAWAPRYNRLAASDITGKVTVWVVGAEISQLTLETGSNLSDLGWSPDAELLITGNDNQIRFWNTTGELTREFEVGLAPEFAWDLRIWPVFFQDSTGTFTSTLQMNEPLPFLNVDSPISTFDLAPNGYDLAYIDANNIAHIRTLNESESTLSFENPGPVTQISWSSDGNYLLLLEVPTDIRIRNAADGSTVLNLRHDSEIHSIHWAANNRIFVVADFIYVFELP